MVEAQGLTSRTALASCARFSGLYSPVGTRFSASVCNNAPRTRCMGPIYRVPFGYRARRTQPWHPPAISLFSARGERSSFPLFIRAGRNGIVGMVW